MTKVAMSICVVASLLLWNWHAVGALQSDILWSVPLNLSNTPQLSTHPAIVADPYGYVHVIWSEEVGGRERQPDDFGGEGNTIFYTRWNGASWTPPIDILFVPGEQVAEFVSIAVGPDDRLHVVWTGQENFYYSNALLWDAESAPAWCEPMVIASDSARSRIESSVAVDANADLHIVYATRGDNAGIYYIHSQDAGVTWTLPRRLSQPFRLSEMSYSTVQIVVDGAGFLHVVWQTNQQQGYGQAVYYVRSVDGGVSWSTPWQFGYRDPGDIFVEWPYLAVRGDMEVHLIYIDGGVSGRLHRISLDNGATWSEPRYILPELEGINGYVVPVVDVNGGIHLIANMRTRAGNVVGIYYARWDEDGWSPAIPLDNSSPAAPSAHYAAAAVSLGREIYIVYTQISIGEIWMLRGVLPSIESVPAREFSKTKEGTLSISVVDSSHEMSETISERSQPAFDRTTQPYVPAAEWDAVIYGLIAAILLVSGVFVGTRVHNSR